MEPLAVRTLQWLAAESGYRVDTPESAPATALLTHGEGRSLEVILGPRWQDRAGRYAAAELNACSQMATFREYSRSARRKSTRGGWMACGMFAPGLESWFGSRGWPPETREMRGQWAQACRSCASTTDRATGWISRNEAARLSCCWPAGTSGPRAGTSTRPCASHKTCRWTP